MGTKNAYNREHFVTVQMGTHLATVWLHQVEVLSAAIGDGVPILETESTGIPGPGYIRKVLLQG